MKISIGNNNKIENSNIGNNNTIRNDNKNKNTSRILEIIIGLIISIISGYILYKLGWNK